MRETVTKLTPALKRDALVTDVGSVKGSVVRELGPLVARAGGRFVGSHPMAGSEKTGPAAASAGLFEGAVCVVTPGGESLPEAVSRVEGLWRAVGASTLRMSPELHDELVSRSSHLPHVAAATLASYVLDPAGAKEQAALCANGFWDTTRIASGSPEMWRDIALANRENLERSINAFVQNLEGFKQALKRSDAKAIEEFFNQAKKRRDAWCGHPISPSPE
jgi:prephenate dehydrogenase